MMQFFPLKVIVSKGVTRIYEERASRKFIQNGAKGKLEGITQNWEHSKNIISLNLIYKQH